LADYAIPRGIGTLGIFLLSTRWISGKEVDVYSETGKRGGVFMAASPCLNSPVGNDYFEKLTAYFEKNRL